jgi:hypothetical protein
MRRFGGDERGVTVQIGAILLFGILVLALATYQAVAVPAQNEEVEFNHNQRVQSDMLDLRGTLGAPVAGADPGSVTVELGTTYPARVLFVDPAPPGGALRTIAGGNTTLENAVATNDETADFVDGTRSYRSRDVVYDPSYSVYQNAPTTALEGAVAVNRGEARSVAISDQRLIDGRTISLVVVRGNLSRAGSGSLAVDPRRVSTATRTPVRNDSAGPLNVTVTTSLPADRWERLLADQPRVTGVAPAARPGAVNVSLAPVAPGEAPYTLRVGVIDVGDGRPPPAPAYVTSPDAPTATLAPGDEVTVAVRDRYNNPVAGSIELTDGAGLVADDDDATPDVYEPADREDGVYRLRYTGGDGTLMASLPNATSAEENVSVAVIEVSAPSGGGNVTVETVLSDGFESGLGNWSTNSQGNVGTTTAQSHLGFRSAVVNGDPQGRLVSDDLDTSGASYLEIEYWAYRTDGPELDEDEDLRLQYQRADGSWKTIDVIRLRDADGSGSPDPRSFSRRLLVPDAEALRDGVRFRFTAFADAGSDAWYVDDVRIYGIGSGSESGESGPPAASQVSYVSGSAGVTGDDSTIEFDVENAGAADVTVTAFAVDSTSVSSARRVERSGDEVVGSRGGRLNEVLQIGGGSPEFDTDATVPAGGRTTFTVGEFVNNGGSDRDMEGEDVTVTLTFEDGSTTQISFTLPD